MDPYSPIDYQIALLRADYRTRTALPIEIQANILLDYSLYPSVYPGPFSSPYLDPYPYPYPVYGYGYGYRRPPFWGGGCRRPCW